MSECCAVVTVERHRKRRGFGGSIDFQHGQQSRAYRLRITGHPHFHDAVALDEGDWSGFKLEISRGSRRRREVMVEQRGDFSDNPPFDEEEATSNLGEAAGQFLLQAAQAGLTALLQARRDELKLLTTGPVISLRVTSKVTVNLAVPKTLWQQVTGDYDAFVHYLLAPDAPWLQPNS